MPAGYLTEATHPWLFKPLQRGGTTDFLQAFQVGAQLKQRQIDNELRVREMEAKWKALDVEQQLSQAKLAAQEQVAAGHAELGQILSEIGANGSWSNPESKAKFWGAAAKHPQLMKDPSFKELTQTFELADTAALRKQLLDAQIGGRVELESLRQQNRLESLTTRLDRMADMKLDDQAFKVELEGLLQEHRLERDKAKSTRSGDPRFNLKKGDEIAYRHELSALLTGLNQGILEQSEYEAKREKVFAKYKALEINSPEAAPTTNSPAVKVFDPATGTFK